MRNLGSKLFVFLILAVIAVGLGYSFMPQPVDVDLEVVKRGTLRVTVDEDGKTRIRDKYVVSAPLSGRILRVDLNEGDKVVTGETRLTTIEPVHPDLLDPRSLAQAEARVKAAEASLRQIEPMLADARAAQDYAEAELQRLRQADRGNAVTDSELEQAEMLYRQRSEGLRSAHIAEEIARFELEQARSALIRTRPDADEQSRSAARPTEATKRNGESGADAITPLADGAWNFPIYSPIDGSVLRVLQESAAVVTPGTPLIELGDPTDLEVEVDVLSRDAVKIEPGDAVLLEQWGGEKPLNGRVRLVEPSGFTKVSTLGVEEQRVNAIIDIVDPFEVWAALGDGYRVEARVIIDEAENALIVPTSALFRVGKENAVFVVKEGIAQQQIVEIGRQNGLEAEVLAGLSEGDVVIVHPSDQVEAGVAVRQR